MTLPRCISPFSWEEKRLIEVLCWSNCDVRLVFGALGTYSWDEKEAGLGWERESERASERDPATPRSPLLKPRGAIISGLRKKRGTTKKGQVGRLIPHPRPSLPAPQSRGGSPPFADAGEKAVRRGSSCPQLPS